MPCVPSTVLALVALVAVAGCSAIVDPDTGTLLNPPPLPCDPGTVNHGCACDDGRTNGTQVCNDLGRYEPCVCDQPAGAGATGQN